VAIGGAATAGTGWHGIATNLDRRRNVVLIVVDTLRADHLGCYGGSARTPNIDMLAEQSVRFTRAYPEAMPTGPARRSILTGRRTFPFHDWQPWESLGKTPGWAPIRPETPTLVSTLGQQGYRTVCVTDNPFLNYAPPFRPLRRSFDRFVAIPGQVRPRRPFDHVSAREATRLLPRSRVREDARHVETMRWYLAANGGGGPDVDERETAAARTFSTAAWALRKASARRPFLLVVDGFDPHEPWAVPRRYLDLYRSPGDDAPAIGDIGYTPAGELTWARSLLGTGPRRSRPSRGARPTTGEPSAAGDRLARPALARAEDRVAGLGGAVAVLEGRAERGDVALAGDRAQQVIDLVNEAVAPAEPVSRRPPVLDVRMAGVGDEHAAEALRAPGRSRPRRVDAQLVEPLDVEGDGALRAVDLEREPVAPPVAEARRRDRPGGAALEVDQRLERVVDGHRAARALRDDGAHPSGNLGDLADQEPGEIDGVRAEVPERARARLLAVEPPDVRRLGVREPVLQVRAAEAVHRADLAAADQLPREAHGRDEAVVEAGHVDDAGLLGRAPDGVALAGVEAERLLTEEVLAGAGGRDRRLGVEDVRARVVEEMDPRVVE
jgi:hypothetical protein